MNLRSFDLNLLVALDALLDTQSVRRAAERLGLSQSATSHALDRLRKLLGDDLLVRTRAGMAATPRALELVTPVHQILHDIQGALAPKTFDAATAEVNLNIAVETYETIVVLPQLVDEVRKEAPGVTLAIRSGSTVEILEGIDQGRIDLAIGRFEGLPGRFMTCRLLSDGHVCTMRGDHPLAQRPLTLEGYLDAPHVIVSMSGSAADPVDAVLAQQGLSRRIVMQLPNGIAAVIALRRSDLIASVTRGAALAFATGAPLVLVDLPFAVPQADFRLAWNRRFHGSPAHIWLRRKLVAIGAAASGAKSEPQQTGRIGISDLATLSI